MELKTRLRDVSPSSLTAQISERKYWLKKNCTVCVCCINITHSSQRKKKEVEVEVEGQEGRQKSKNRTIFTRPNGAPGGKRTEAFVCSVT